MKQNCRFLVLVLTAIIITMVSSGGYSLKALASDAPELKPYDVDGNGKINSGEEAYEIKTADDLYWFAEYVNSFDESAKVNAYLANDIVINEDLLTNKINVDEYGTVSFKDGVDATDVRLWTPIGYIPKLDDGETPERETLMYEGTFDGANHSISGIYLWHDREKLKNPKETNDPENPIDVALYDDVGLFGDVGGCVIKNLSIKDSCFYGNCSVGGICGQAAYSEIKNCSVEAILTGRKVVGGICGLAFYNEIINCNTNIHISGFFEASDLENNEINCPTIYGGICGCANGGSILNSKSSGKICGIDELGGIVADIGENSQIENCISDVEISGISIKKAKEIDSEIESTSTFEYSNIGGIVARLEDSAIISKCSFEGKINCNAEEVIRENGKILLKTGGYKIGGICGIGYSGTIEYCSNIGVINGSDFVGGIIGLNCAISPKYCFNIGNIVAENNFASISGYDASLDSDTDYKYYVKGDNEYNSCYSSNQYSEGAYGNNGLGVSKKYILNGKLCYLLNGSSLNPTGNDSVFYQDLGIDPYPVLDNTHHDVSSFNEEYSNIHTDRCLIKIPSKESTCIECGTAEYYICKHTGKYFKKVGINYEEIENFETWRNTYGQGIIGKTGHYYVNGSSQCEICHKYKPVSVFFDAGDIDLDIYELKTSEETGKVIGKFPVPVRKGYTFRGWYIYSVKITEDRVFTENVTLIAKWKENDGGNTSPDKDPGNVSPSPDKDPDNIKPSPDNDPDNIKPSPDNDPNNNPNNDPNKNVPVIKDYPIKAKLNMAVKFAVKFNGTVSENTLINGYKLSDKTLARISKKGILTLKKEGKLEVTALHKEGKGKSSVVSELGTIVISIKKADIDKKLNVYYLNEGYDLNQLLKNKFEGQKVNFSQTEKTKKIGVISENGIFIAKKDGKLKVSCIIGEGDESVKYTVNIKVKTPSMNIKDGVKMKVGAKKKIKLKNIPSDALGKITWLEPDSTKAKLTVLDEKTISIEAITSGELTLSVNVDGRIISRKINIR